MKLITFLLIALPLLADQYLFTSFRRNGETGVFFALSQDGQKWTPLSGNQAILTPQQPGMLMRDPFLTRGPDGTWHLLWTWGWNRKETGGKLRLGYASSRDLVKWSAQRAIDVMEDEPEARNAWAPEAVYDDAKREWIVFWSTTISGRFPNTETTGDSGYNHRIYAARTKDWQSFTPAKLWFDPGFNCIDATVVRDGKRTVLIFKDERLKPEKKNLRLAFSPTLSGPWSGVTEPFSPSWVEGPSALRIGEWWWVYFDHYRAPRHYGAMRTRDWKTFEPVDVSFPEDHRHGTAVRISNADAARLQALGR